MKNGLSLSLTCFLPGSEVRRIFLIFLLVPFFARADLDHLFSSQEEDLALFHHVNVITGNLNLCLQDGIVRGAKSIPLLRTYTSAGALERIPSNFDIVEKVMRKCLLSQGGWNLFPHTSLTIEPALKIKQYKAFLAEPSGSMIAYHYHEEKGHKISLKPENRVSQQCGILSGRTNPENYLLQIHPKKGEAILYLANGGIRTYLGDSLHHFNPNQRKKYTYQLQSEILPSKHRLDYSYDHKDRLVHIDLKNPSGSKTFSWVHFDLIKNDAPFHFQARTSDGKILNYHALKFKYRDYLYKVHSNCKSEEISAYVPGRKSTGARMEALGFGGTTQFKVSYYLPPDRKTEEKWIEKPHKKDFSADKVHRLEAPIGPNGEMCVMAEFSYYPDHTDVRDVDRMLTRYFHDSQQLLRIEYFDQQERISASLKLIWSGSRLLSKIQCDAEGLPLIAKTFHYDASGNVIDETVWGNLTGTAPLPFSIAADGSLYGSESYRKQYVYLPHYNIPLVEVEDEGLTYRYVYQADTDLLIAKLTCNKDEILGRHFFCYNEDHLLVAEIIDDGRSTDAANLHSVTQRSIKRYDLDPHTGLARSITEQYWDPNTQQELLLKRTDLTYAESRVIAEAIFDAHEQYRYTIHTRYDTFGNIASKTTPLGKENIYRYDPLGQLLYISEAGSFDKSYTYDSAGRPTLCVETDFALNRREIHSSYDNKGRLLTLSDHKGNITHQSYDDFGRCLSTTFPATQDEKGEIYTPTIHFTYDTQGNLASTLSPKKETTQTVYNALRKPTRIIHPDHTETHHTYYRNGTLAKTCYADGTEIHYSYDPFQRVTVKTTYSAEKTVLSAETWKYSTYQLLSHTDPRGLVTTYTYDGAGRKIAEESEGRVQTYSYDALGFLETTTEGEIAHVQLHDVEGQIIEEWTQDSLGNQENHMWFTYDTHGFKVQAERLTSQGKATDLFSYDGAGRLSRHIDPLGAVTAFNYSEDHLNELNQKVLQKTTIDPLGHSTIETYDALNKITSQEKCDLSGKIVAKEEYLYDRAGNRARRITSIYQSTAPTKKVSSYWEYDAMARVIKEMEAETKTTLYSYDSRGRMKSKTLPSGTTLHYQYDGIDRLVQLQSTDSTIHYQYLYDRGPDPVCILDLLHHTKLERTYNAFGEMLTETSPVGLHLSWQYDPLGRCTLFTLPDRSSISYTYREGHLTVVTRQTPEGSSLYTHHYAHFDENGHVAEEELIHAGTTLTTTRDILERPILQISPQIEQTITYGPSSLVTKIESSMFGSTSYQYDPLNQLLKEGEQEYLFDSIGNPLDCSIGACNQILSTPHDTLTYDLNGNPTTRLSPDEATTYTYDALDRLTSITTPQKRQVTYTYDPLSRLLTKQTYTYQNHNWHLEDHYYYLYDHEDEIGTLTPQGALRDLKVLGLGIKGDIGAAIALELKGTPYAPLHDFHGNIIGLLSPNGSLLETYNIDAFGKDRSTSPPLSPWRFCSKRSEENLIFFRHRAYDPLLQRWLTPDPAGFTDGPNLYVYVLNSPLNRLDLFGLASEQNFPQLRIEFPIYTFNNLPSTATLLHTSGFIGEAAVDWIVSCGHWHQIQFTPEELKSGTVNIANHFHELFPKDGVLVGLLTAQNGIRNELQDFYFGIGKPIIKKLSEGTLFIGLHNPTEGSLKKDYVRTNDEHLNKETPIVAKTRQFFSAIVEHLHKINPELLWMHIPHSEGGLIALRAIEGLTPEHKSLLQQKLLLFAVAPALPVPKKYGRDVINIYSQRDRVTKGCSIPYKDNPDYDIRYLEPIGKRSWIAEHQFLSPTYQKALDIRLNKTRENYGLYNPQNR